jgi:hypothetical protein
MWHAGGRFDLVRKSEGRRSLRIPRRRLDDNIKIELKESQEVVNWNNLAQDRDK